MSTFTSPTPESSVNASVTAAAQCPHDIPDTWYTVSITVVAFPRCFDRRVADPDHSRSDRGGPWFPLYRRHAGRAPQRLTPEIPVFATASRALEPVISGVNVSAIDCRSIAVREDFRRV
jgi:hypothetical protein